MATRERIVREVADIAQHPKAVTFEEIERIVNHIKGLGEVPVDGRKTKHGYQYTIGPKIFSVCHHNPGSKHIKKCYIEDFLDAMVDLGFYEE
jgi:hypothetical protein